MKPLLNSTFLNNYITHRRDKCHAVMLSMSHTDYTVQLDVLV